MTTDLIPQFGHAYSEIYLLEKLTKFPLQYPLVKI